MANFPTNKQKDPYSNKSTQEKVKELWDVGTYVQVDPLTAFRTDMFPQTPS